MSRSPSATVEISADDRLVEPTLASTWQAVAGSPIEDELLEWPPDVFALTDSDAWSHHESARPS
jgi:hypothetical protein